MLKETPFFIDNNGTRQFAVLHEAEVAPLNQGFVFCHAFAEEKLWSHRVLVSMARDLAAAGYTVLRFDHRGYGDSDGAFAECQVDTYLADIAFMVSTLRDKCTSLQSIGLLGHRLGAMFALMSSSLSNVNGPIILWDPVIDGDRHMQEFLRSHLTTQMAVYGEVKETREKLVEKINTGELVNVEGYDLAREQFNSISQLKLSTISRHTNSDNLVVQIGRNDKPKKDSQELVDLTQADLRCVVEEPFWREIKRFYYKAFNMSQVTLDWLGSR